MKEEYQRVSSDNEFSDFAASKSENSLHDSINVEAQVEQSALSQLRAAVNGFHPVSDRAFQKLSSLAEMRSLVKGEVLVEVGQVSSKKYFICSGIVVSVFGRDNGNLHIKNFFTAGNFAASTVSSLREGPSQFEIRCSEKAEILQFDYRAFKKEIFADEELKSFYIGYLEAKWVVENESRQISFATQTAAERYERFMAQYPGLIHRVSLQDIASFIGVSPTQLSRIRKKILHR